MVYEVLVGKKVLKNIEKMPIPLQKKLVNLIDDLCEKGPLRIEWPHFSKLGEDRYHCHLAHKWVACWQWKKQSIIIESILCGQS